MAGGRDKKKMKRIATFVTKGFKEQLQRHAKRKGTTVSDMIRDLLKEELWSDLRFGVVSKPPPTAREPAPVAPAPGGAAPPTAREPAPVAPAPGAPAPMVAPPTVAPGADPYATMQTAPVPVPAAAPASAPMPAWQLRLRAWAGVAPAPVAGPAPAAAPIPGIAKATVRIGGIPAVSKPLPQATQDERDADNPSS